ncbi:phage shock protein operon transcriptional activator [Neiella sp. HB171785]|uniref:Phage shock protein operon transcriptional activator n=1 Tax=Neiella litorisoli TaxID=2771431 RepID=A0A8J6QRM4_9GAMM|nr:phage shock protein operon transcriptional activator [Neiella litorisoli]MBD1390321.1 phage shock protein operon transcriptional activator [Neiella litorisoli]
MQPQQDNLLGESNSFLEVLERISQIAPLNKPVLIIGERGTGKELIAERLHFLSSRWDQQYIKLNCAALNESLLESELFGHEAGSFTGSGNKRRAGRFELADKGTLFLDELANTSGLIQEKLLRVIEYGEFERVGGSQSIKVDVRLVAATNEDLPTLAERNEFRSDLLDRLAFDVITLPPLRARRSDIMLLADAFAIKMARQLDHPVFSGFSREARELLLDYHWPGNVRELKNVVERSVYRHNDPEMQIDQIILDPFESEFRPGQTIRTKDRRDSEPQTQSQQPPQAEDDNLTIPSFPFDLKAHLQDHETAILQKALEQHQFNQKKTADALSLTYHQLRGILKKYNLLDGINSGE